MTTVLNSLWRFGPLLSEDRYAVPVEPLAPIFTRSSIPEIFCASEFQGSNHIFIFDGWPSPLQQHFRCDLELLEIAKETNV